VLGNLSGEGILLSLNQLGLRPNLVISVAELSCLEVWKLTAPQLIALVPASEYWLIVPDTELQSFMENSPVEFKVLPESNFTQDFSEKFSQCDGAAMPARRGWYLQQLIKLSALEKASQLDRVVLWDADTIPLRGISFFDVNGNCRYFFGSEYHLPYFENIDRLLGLDKAHPNSFIAQNFPIKGNQIQAFFSYVEKRHQSKWWDAVIDSIDFDEVSGFSEYETLGTFISSFDKTLSTVYVQPGTWSRDGNLGWVTKQINSQKAAKAKYDFVAVERWTKNILEKPYLLWVRMGIRSYLGRIMSLISPHFRIFSFSLNLENYLEKIFHLDGEIDVIQIGANDGIQSDPLRRFIQSPGRFSARLVEPIPFYCQELIKLYKGRSDVEIINCAAGSNESTMDIFHIEPEKAIQMNGNGPHNNWALGQGSSSRATVVYWIYKNSWRGASYVDRIPDWIASIEKLQVRVMQTRDLVRDGAKTLLVIDVQGMESEVILGLCQENLPRWVVIEEDLGKKSARKLLIGLGYREIFAGSDTLFELNQEM
jgi:FkbM family methyltransferase